MLKGNPKSHGAEPVHNHHDELVDSDQAVVNKEVTLSTALGKRRTARRWWWARATVPLSLSLSFSVCLSLHVSLSVYVFFSLSLPLAPPHPLYDVWQFAR